MDARPPAAQDSARPADRDERTPGALSRAFRLLAMWTGEAGLAIGLVVVFFAVCLLLLGFAFPRGVRLAELMASRRSASSGPGGGDIDVNLCGRPNPWRLGVLSEVHRRVKEKGADMIVWADAAAGTALDDQHAVQTLSNATATITFEDRSTVTLGPNSLLVLRRPRHDAADGGRGVTSIMVADGAIEGTPGRGGASAKIVEIVTGSGSARMYPAGGRLASYKVAVNADHSTTFNIYDGRAEVTSAGKTVQVPRNYFVTVLPSQPPGEPRPLPPAPDVVAPPDDATLAYRVAPPEIHLQWTGDGPHTTHRVVIARDEKMRDIVHEERVVGDEFVHASFGDGEFRWQVSAVDGGAEGPGAPARRFHVVKDLDPPALEAVIPDASPAAQSIVVRGRAEPGADVFVGKERAPVDKDGTFERTVALARGVNVVVVEAIDAAGNTTYRSKLVKAVY